MTTVNEAGGDLLRRRVQLPPVYIEEDIKRIR
jgi:hypothetical protein